MKTYLEILKHQLNNRVDLVQKRRGIFQLISPFYHEDGDMMEIFIEERGDNGTVRISDHGMTLMRLSYGFDVNTPNKKRILQKILAENQISEEEGRLYIDSPRNELYASILQFVQGVGKVSNLQVLRREVIKSLFYEMLEEFVMERLAQFAPKKNILPIALRDDLEVDFQLSGDLTKQVFLFGIKDNAKARLTTICCLEFQKNSIPFRSIAVHEDFDSLSRKDRKRITSAIDKQFTDLDDFKENGRPYLLRDAA